MEDRLNDLRGAAAKGRAMGVAGGGTGRGGPKPPSGKGTAPGKSASGRTDPRIGTLGTKSSYVNNNPRATPAEIGTGELLHNKAQSGELPGIRAVEGAPEAPKGKGRSADYRFVKDNGDKVSADVHHPESDNLKSIQSNIYEKSGQANVVVVELGRGKSGQIDTNAAQAMAKQVVSTSGLSIDRVIVIKEGNIIADAHR
jgi:hypothetical protein